MLLFFPILQQGQVMAPDPIVMEIYGSSGTMLIWGIIILGIVLF
jgi:hypothetical protein